MHSMMQDKTLHALWAWTVHLEIIYCRKKQKELTVSRAQMSETENGTNRVELSSCTLPDFEKRAAKPFYHDDQTISCRRICKGEQSLTSENGSFGDVCRSMCTLQRPFTFGSHQLTFDLERCFSFWKCMQMVEAGANLSESSFKLSRRPEGECVCHGRRVGLHAHYVLLVSHLKNGPTLEPLQFTRLHFKFFICMLMAGTN